MMSRAQLSLSQQNTEDKFVSKFRWGSRSYQHIDITAEETTPDNKFMQVPSESL